VSEEKKLISRTECAVLLRVDKTKLWDIENKAKDFPKHESGGIGRSPKLYDYEKVRAWYMANKKGLDDDMAQRAIRGQIWPVYRPQHN